MLIRLLSNLKNLSLKNSSLKNSLVSLCLFVFVAYSLPVFAANPKILIYGDSLSASYGIPQQHGWAALLKEKLMNENLNYDVINASISGETTDGGLNRIENTLRQTKPEIVILELGANDGLRGLPLANMHKNLSTIITLSRKSGAKVLLVGMRIPPNYGKKYTEEFNQVYIKLAKHQKLAIVPFMLQNIAAKPDLIQQDGLHPNAAAQPIILENIWQQLHGLLVK